MNLKAFANWRRFATLYCCLIASLILATNAIGQTNTWDGSSDANWNTAANWSLGVVPTSAHDVVIPDGITSIILVNTSAVCLSFTMNSGGQDNRVRISGTNSLSVTDAVTIGTGTGFGDEKNLSVDGGSLTCASLTISTAAFFRTSRVIVSTGTVTVTGDITIGNGAGTNAFQFNASGTLNVGGNMSGGDLIASTSTVNYDGSTQTVGAYDYNNLTYTGSGVKTMTGVNTIGGNFIMSGTSTTTATENIDVNGSVTLSSGTSFTAGAFAHTVAGNWTNNGASVNNSNSTITFDGAAQSIGGSIATSFNNLTLEGSGTKTFGFATTIDGLLDINSAVVADLGTFTTHTANALVLGGVGQITGTWGSTASAATNQNDTYFTAASIGIITTAVLGPTTYYSRQTGDWDATTTWSTVTYGNATNLGTFPVAGDIVNIGGGNFTVSVNVASACASLNFQGETSNSPIVSIDPGITLDVSGAIDIPSAPSFDGAFNTLAVGAGTLNASSIAFSTNFLSGIPTLTISTGTATVSGDVTSDAAAFTNPSITFTGSGLLQVAGAFLDSSNGTLTPSTGTVEYNGSVAQSIGDFTYNNLTLSGSGVKTTAGALDIDGTLTLSSGTSFTAGAFTHTIAGNWINNGATFTNSNSTISLDGAAQSIGGTNASTFNNLTLAGTNAKTFGFATTIDATLSINAGVVANLGTITTHTARTLALNGTGQIPGTWGSTASAATNQNDTYFTAAATGILTVTSWLYYTRQTGNWNSNATWSTVTYGNATNTGTFPVAGDVVNIGGGDFTITVNVASACAFMAYQANSANSPIVSISTGITLDVSESITIPEASGFADDNTLAVAAGTLNVGSIVFADGGSGFAEPLLTISTGTVTVSGDVSVSGTPDATITFTDAGLMELAGAFLNSGNCTLTPSTGTIEYNGTVAQSIGDFTYYNLTVNNTLGTIPELTLAGNTTATNLLTMTSGVVDLDGSSLTLGASGAVSSLSRTASTTTNWVYGGTFTRFWPAATAVTSGSGNFYGLLPVGTATASSYRPVEINSTVSPTGTGSFSVTHVDASTVTDLSPVFDDGGTDIVRKHDAQFVTASSVTGGTYDINVTMTGLATGTLSDIRLAISNGSTIVTTVGTHAAATGTAPNPTAGRTGVSLANLAGDWRITTTNSTDTPLPIELISFDAVPYGSNVLVKWSTASEQNNDFFSVERSDGIGEWQLLGTVAGAGNSTRELQYEFWDNAPILGSNYYRLKQTDFDGTSTYSSIRLVIISDTDLISVYPNPFEQKFLIYGNLDILNSDVSLYNVLGDNVSIEVEAQDDRLQIKTDQLKPGVYFLKVLMNNSVRTLRILKQ